MREGWQEVALGEIATVFAGSTPSTKEASYWAGGDKVWVTPTDITGLRGREISDSRRKITQRGLDKLGGRTAPKGAVLVTSRATVGAAAIAGCEVALNQGVTALVPNPDVDSRWLYYWVASVRDELIARAAGSTFLEISRSTIRQLSVALPPLEEQQRIADLLGSLDAAAEAASERAEAAIVLKARFLGQALDALDEAERKPLGSLADVQSGISWTKASELPTGDPAGIGVMGVTNVQRDHVHASGCGWIKRTPQAERRAIAEHTILMIRTNGNPDRIGNVHRAPAEAIGYTISSFLTGITPNEPEETGYLLRVLQSPQVQDAITAATSGSTGLKNIAVTWIRSVEIPWPTSQQRREVTATAAAFDAVVAAYSVEAQSFQQLRDALLTSLLSGSRGVPESYDQLIAANGVGRKLAEVAA